MQNTTRPNTISSAHTLEQKETVVSDLYLARPASSSNSKPYPHPLPPSSTTTLMSHKPKREWRLNEAHEKRNEEILKHVQNIRSKVSVEEALAQYDRIKKGSNRYES
jgi:hypothetical protein